MAEGQKTEQPTQKKIKETKEKGEIPRSIEFNNFVVLIGLFICFFFGFKSAFNSLLYFIYKNFKIASKPYNFNHVAYVIDAGIIFFKIILPIFLFIFLFTLLVMLIQNGFNFATKAIRFDLNKINPISGIKRIFSGKAWIELAKSIIKLTIIFFIIFQTIWDEKNRIFYLSTMDKYEIIKYSGFIIFEIFKKILIFSLILAIIDLLWQKKEYFENLKMTKYELKQELKQTEGDIKVKSKIKAWHRKRLKYKLKNMVKEATFVTVNPTHYAVAIKYVKGMKAPRLVAKGVDHVAKRIKEYAIKFNIPIVNNPELTKKIYYTTELGKYIPASLYKAVAKILVFIYKMEREKNAERKK